MWTYFIAIDDSLTFILSVFFIINVIFGNSELLYSESPKEFSVEAIVNTYSFSKRVSLCVFLRWPGFLGVSYCYCKYLSFFFFFLKFCVWILAHLGLKLNWAILIDRCLLFVIVIYFSHLHLLKYLSKKGHTHFEGEIIQ